MKLYRSKHWAILLVTSIYLSTSATASEPALDRGGLTGFWASQGTGVIVDINHDGVSSYDVTTISCIRTEQLSPDQFFSGLGSLLQLNANQQQFQLRLPGNVIDLQFNRLTTLPDRCANGGTQASRDPELNFEVFWHTFAENYPGFGKRGVDWQQLYQQYRPQVNPQTTDAELFALFGRMIDPLNDGHIRISDNNGHTLDSFHNETDSAVIRQLTREFHQQQRIDNLQQYIGLAIGSVTAVVKQNYLEAPVKTGVLKDMFWGRTADGFGYLYLGGFDDPPAQENNEDAPSPSVQMSADIRTSMIEMMTDLKAVKGLMIDVRLNPGGNDWVAFEVARFFNDQRRPVFSVQTALPEFQLSRAQTAYLPVTEGDHFRKPIAILTSEATASAAEIFTLAMRELPNVTLIGETTSGNLSNALEKQLPNGWTFEVAPNVYRSQDGRVFEGEGIPPHVHVPTLQRTDRVLGTDAAIDTAKRVLALDQTVLTQMEAAKIPALSTSLVVNGQTVLSKAYGYADLDSQRRATENTPFGMASVSKTLIGVAIMQLVEQGILSLDTAINSILPFSIDNPKLEGEIITVRHLASHSSGLIDNAGVYNNSYKPEPEPVQSLGAILKDYFTPEGALYHAQLNFAATQPGEHYEYSNIAASLAAYVVETKTGQSFDDYVEQHIFKPLQMSNSHYHLAQFPVNTVAIPYGEDNEGQFYHYPTYPDGMFHTSAHDLAAYMIDLTTGQALLQRASIERLWTPVLSQNLPLSDNEGIFWDIGRFGAINLVGHGGSDFGVASELRIIPELGVGAAVVMNTDREDEADRPNAADKVLVDTIKQLILMGSSMATSLQSTAHASGSWYDPATDGQGFHIEILPDDRAVVVWFGYDGQGRQRWITGAGQVVGNRVDIPSAYLTTGGEFGSGFDPAAVQRKLWGELVFEFTAEGNDATGATLVYNRLEGAKHGQVTLKRLTHNYQPEASETMRNMTGTWFDPEHNGEGFIVQALSKTEATLHWFTYTVTGDQAWLVGKGRIEGDTYSFPDMQITSMASSGNGSQTTQVSRQTWGSVNLTVNSCQQLAAQYQSQSGSGKLTLKRLTVPVAVECR